MTFTLGFSPCPNDTFIFDALVNHKIDTGDISFHVMLEDVQTLNEWALQGKLDFSKISYGVLPLITQQYNVLNSGGALGKGVGPLLITKNKSHTVKDVPGMTVAIPGVNTTAHLLFSFAFPGAVKKVFKVFHEIEDAVLQGDADAGVIIHENRFTYQQKGLYRLMDLGTFWEEKKHIPIPLGGIIAKKNIDKAIVLRVDALIRQSLQVAFGNHPLLPSYVKQHSQEMSEAVMRQHIDLYVNDYSIDMGEDGKQAVHTLMQLYRQLNPGTIIPPGEIFR